MDRDELPMAPPMPVAKTIVGKQIEISVLFDVVSINIHCGDDYEAQVFYDDIVARVMAGETITIAMAQPKL